jgi:crotonobetainyl-CoA:carnitine CoA-transferase CaiB-like acyl-CoA transferase
MSGPLPLAGTRVLEFTHRVMGPTCGMIRAGFGAEVVKVEALGGGGTRRRIGSGAGFFPTRRWWGAHAAAARVVGRRMVAAANEPAAHRRAHEARPCRGR